jgi:hypothetical protein
MPSQKPSPAAFQALLRRVSAESYTQPEYGTLWVSWEQASGAAAAKTATPSGSIAWSGGPMAAGIEQTYLCMLVESMQFTCYGNDPIDASALAQGGMEVQIDASGIYKLGFGLSQGTSPAVSGSTANAQGGIEGVPARSGTLQPWCLGADTFTATPQTGRSGTAAIQIVLSVTGYIWNNGTTERPAWFTPLSDRCDPSAIPGNVAQALARAYEVRGR